MAIAAHLIASGASLSTSIAFSKALPLAQRPAGVRAGPLSRALEVAAANSLEDGIRYALAASKPGPFRDVWLPFLDAYERSHSLPKFAADVRIRPLNQYLALDLPRAERIRLLRSHYSLLPRLASRRLLEQMLCGGAIEIGNVAGKAGAYALRLCSTPSALTRKEGEITVALRASASAMDLAKMTFLFASDETGCLGMMIGGIQGSRSPAAKQSVVAATRDLFGLRPRDAVLIATLAIARTVGIEQVWAISSGMHVHHARGGRHRERFFLDYDAYWTERGARRDWPFGWTLDVPSAPTRTGTTQNGRRRDAAKDSIWRLAQSEFSAGPDREDAAPASPEPGHALVR